MGFFDSDFKTVLPMEKQQYYIDDTFGLRTLDESNRLTLKNIPGVPHPAWIQDTDVISQYILPCLED